MQDLLDDEATLGNIGAREEQRKVWVIIKLKREGPPPICWGEDDCSTSFLVRCPWRIDCGS